MLNYETIGENFVLVVLVGCLVVGYLIKHTFDMIPNKYIPTILAVLGAILNTAVGGFTIENFIYGALMGLSSTGMHQAFSTFIENTEK